MHLRTALLLRALITMLIVPTLFTGCYSSEQINPTELPKLNDASIELVSYERDGNRTKSVWRYSLIPVEKPDGTVLTVQGSFDAVVTTSGSAVEFKYPVEARVMGDELAVQGSNRPSMSFALPDVQKVEVRQFSTTRTYVFVIASLLGGALAATAVAYLVTQ